MKILLQISIYLFVFAISNGAFASVPDFDKAAKEVREILKALIEADTSNPPGNEAKAVAIASSYLKKNGFDEMEIFEFAPGRQDLLVHLKGSGKKRPLILMGHLDVVGTKSQKWSVEPHQLTEKDGYLYGRGVLDMLGMVATEIETMILLKQQGKQLERDVYLALTGDEESGGAGIKYLLEKKPELKNAELALNEGGAPRLMNGQVKYISFQVAEKTYQDFILTARGPSGHSARPKKENAIYFLAKALGDLEKHKLRPRLILATREFFQKASAFEVPEMKKAMQSLVNAKGKLPETALKVIYKNPEYQSLLATTCIPTLINGGSRENALPVEATANINCRILPDESIESVTKYLRASISDPNVEIKLANSFGSGPAVPTTGPVYDAAAASAENQWPGVKVIPSMQTGGTDSRFLRREGIHAYGLMPFSAAEVDVARVHGIDERVPISGIRPGVEFFYGVVTRLVY